MKTDQNNQNNTSSQGVQDLISQLNNLVDEAKKVNQEIDETNNEAREEMKNLEVKIDESINKLEQIYSDLDQIEKDAGDELDKLILQQSGDLASE